MELQFYFIFATAFFGIAVAENGESKPGFLPAHPMMNESNSNSIPPPAGREVQVGNLTVYESLRPQDTKLMLISIYDIFGLHPHVKYISDKLSEAGFFVVIPDLFHGNPVPIAGFPQPSFPERATTLFAQNGSWVEIKPELLNLMKHYKEKYGITAVGMYGFCWGGKISVFAASDKEFTDNDLKGIGLVHPSRVTTDEAAGLKVPGILLPSRTEPDMLPFLRTLNANVKSYPSEHHRYNSMNHGFAGATSDFGDPNIRRNVEDAIVRLSKFFKRVME